MLASASLGFTATLCAKIETVKKKRTVLLLGGLSALAKLEAEGVAMAGSRFRCVLDLTVRWSGQRGQRTMRVVRETWRQVVVVAARLARKVSDKVLGRWTLRRP